MDLHERLAGAHPETADEPNAPPPHHPYDSLLDGARDLPARTS